MRRTNYDSSRKTDNVNYWMFILFKNEYFEFVILWLNENLVDTTLKSKFNKEGLFKFWADNKNFGLYLRKHFKFYCRAFIFWFKTNKYRNKLNADSHLRLYLTSVEPDIKQFWARKQVKNHIKYVRIWNKRLIKN